MLTISIPIVALICIALAVNLVFLLCGFGVWIVFLFTQVLPSWIWKTIVGAAAIVFIMSRL